MNLTLISDCLEKAVELSPEEEALVYGNRSISYQEFLANAQQIAKAFLELGIKKGDRIAVLMPNCPEYLYTYMASSLVGGMMVGINPAYKGPEIAFILNNSLPKALVMIDKHRDIDFQKLIREYIFPGVIPHIIIHNTQQSKKFIIRKALSFDNLLSQESTTEDEELLERKKILSGDDAALVIYTSGTTGKPKGAVLTHKNILTSIGVEVREWDISSRDRLLLHLHMSHIGGAAELSVAGLMGRSTLIIMDHFNPVDALRLIEKEKITFLGQVPAMFALMFNVSDFDSYDLSSIRTCAVAGAPTPAEVMKKMYTIGDGVVRTGYGLAETAGLVTYTSRDDSPETVMNTVGRPAPEFQVKIVDDERNELPLGESGEIAIKGDCVLSEYYELPAETEKVMDEKGWFYTGDIGFLDEDGYLRLRGRKKDMIITGGYTVFPQEIEDKLIKHPNIQLAAVCGVPDPVLGETGRAYIVPQEGNTFKQKEIIAYLEQNLAEFKIPRQFVFRQSLPLTTTGKVEKRILQEEIANEG